MNKIINSVLFVFCLSLTLASCSDDDKNKYEVTKEWKDYQRNVFDKIMDSVIADVPVYKRLESQSKNGAVYYKQADMITKIMEEEENPDALKLLKVDHEYPALTDQVVVRYEGWVYDIGGKKILFDSTEHDKKTGKPKNVREPVTFSVAPPGLIDGFSTMLQNMKVGEEYEVCIPYALAYGEIGNIDQFGNLIIPGYSTLFFDIKLLEIK